MKGCNTVVSGMSWRRSVSSWDSAAGREHCLTVPLFLLARGALKQQESLTLSHSDPST